MMNRATTVVAFRASVKADPGEAELCRALSEAEFALADMRRMAELEAGASS